MRKGWFLGVFLLAFCLGEAYSSPQMRVHPPAQLITEGPDAQSIAVEKNGDASWGGVVAQAVPIPAGEGLQCTIQFEMRCTDIGGNAGDNPAQVICEGWFANQPGMVHPKERHHGRMFFRVTTPGEWQKYNLRMPVPPSGEKFFQLVWTFFRNTTGKLEVRALRCEVDPALPVRFTHASSENAGSILLAPGVTQTLKLAIPNGAVLENRISYNDQGFLQEIAVADSIHHQPAVNDLEAWMGDSLQFALDPLFDRKEEGYSTDDDCEYGLAIFADGKCRFQVYTAPPNYPPQLEAIRYQGKRDDANGRTEYRLLLPWSAFGPMKYQESRHFGFNFLLNDSNGKKRSYTEWTPATGQGKYPGKMGVVLLDKAGSGRAGVLEPAVKELHTGMTLPVKALLHCRAPRKVTFAIELSNGKKCRFTKELPAGESVMELQIPAEELRVGENTVRISCHDDMGVILQETIRCHVKSQAARRQEVEGLLATNTKLLAECTQMLRPWEKRQGAYPREEVAFLRIAQVFMERFIPSHIREGEWERARQEAGEVRQLLELLRQRLQAGKMRLEAPRRYSAVKNDQGTLVDGAGVPIMPIGYYFARKSKYMSEPLLWQDFNVGVATGYEGTQYWVKNEGEKILPAPPGDFFQLRPWLKFMAEQGTLSTPLMHLNFTAAMKKLWPEGVVTGNHFLDLDVDHPKVRQMLQVAYETMGKSYVERAGEGVKSVLAVDLQNEPAFGTFTGYSLVDFRRFLQEKYSTVAQLNESYGCKLESWEALTDRQQLGNGQMAVYDYNRYNCQRFNQFFIMLRQALKKGSAASPLPVTLKIMNGMCWGRWARSGIGYDLEAVGDLVDLVGGDTTFGYSNDQRYAAEWWIQAMALDFFKSTHPGKPIIENELHVRNDRRERGWDFMGTVLLHGALHGRNSAAIWTLSREVEGMDQYFKTESAQERDTYVDARPMEFASFIAHGMMAERMLPIARHFYQAPRPVRLLFSQNSFDYGSANYINILREMYCRLNFSHLPLGFVTEGMLLEKRIPAEVRAIVVAGAQMVQPGVPEALAALEKAGVQIIRVTDKELQVDTYGKPLPKVNFARAPLGGVGKVDGEALIAQLQIPRPFRLQMESGANPPAVEARFVKVKGVTWGYACNFGVEEVAFQVVDSQGKIRLTQEQYRVHGALRQERTITLKPMETRIFQVQE